MPTNVVKRTKPKEVLEQMGPEVYRQAYSKGMCLSAYLEREDPSSGYNDGMDAFQRLMSVAGIRTSRVDEIGLPASTFEEFCASPKTRALVPEWISRIRRAQAYGRNVRGSSLLLSDDATVGTWERPYVESNRVEWDERIQPAIPLSSLIALTTPITGDTYRTMFLEHEEENVRLVRVSEAADIPEVTLKGSEQSVTMYKFGRALRASYEQLRRTRLDKVRLWVERVGLQIEVDKVGAVLDVMINGDGNSGTEAEVFTLTGDLDTGAVAGTLSLRGWLAFKMKFTNPYSMGIALCNEGVALDLQLLDTGNANLPLFTIANQGGFGGFSPINPDLNANVGLGWTGLAPANKVVACDTRFAIERIYEIGADIAEIERFALNQTEVLILSEVEGYATMDSKATKIMDIAS